ncbi:MAG TPA: Ig-like domain-containing protein [Terracidiphilus sp.]|nr:Ig-like domain-containing protein [Terracidiphilus sp.]
MRYRSSLGALLLIGGLLPITSCSTSPSLTSITVDPASVTTSFSAGLQVEFIAVGNYTRPGHTPVTMDITDQVTWTSSFQQMVTINSQGVATVQGFGYGNGNIYAAYPGFHGDIVGTAAFTVSAPSSTPAVRSLTLTHDSTATAVPNATVQFTATGKMNDGSMAKLSGQPKWTSTDNQVATIDESTGLLTTLGVGRTTIVATYTNADGTTAVGVTRLYVTPPTK